MKIATTVKYAPVKNCLAYISATLVQNLSATNDVLAARVTLGEKVCYLSLVLSNSENNLNELAINSLYANKLNIKDNSTAVVEVMTNVPKCSIAWMEPESVDDWEILELHSSQVEDQLLQQIRIVWPGQIFPLWVGGNVCVYMKTAKTEPSSECCLLMHSSELYVAPKVKQNSAEKLQKPDHTVVPLHSEDTADEATTNSVPNSRNVSTLFRYTLIPQFLNVIKFLCLYIWRRFLPNLFSHFRSIFFPAQVEKLSVDFTNFESRLERIKAQVELTPDNIDFVARVEPIDHELLNQSSVLTSVISQPALVFLHSDYDVSSNSMEYLVSISKVQSPVERIEIGKNMKKSQQKSEKESSDVEGTSQVCVARMYVRGHNKFNMNCSWNGLNGVQTLNVSSILRRQLNMGVTSRVRVKKLKQTPELGNKIDAINFSILPCVYDSGLDVKVVSDAFMEWLSHVSDADNMLPISMGSLLSFPLNDDRELEIEVVVKSINCGEGVKPDGTTYMLCADDLENVVLNFTQDKETLIAVEMDVDVKLPTQNMLLHCQGLEPEVKALVKFVETAISTRPLPNALSLHGAGLRPTCVLVTGGKGVGKSTLGRAVLRKFGLEGSVHAFVHCVSCSVLRGKKPDNIRRLFNKVSLDLRWREPSVLLLDDLDLLIPASTSEEEGAGEGVYNLQLVSVVKSFLHYLMGRTKHGWGLPYRVCVVATCQSKSAVHQSIMTGGNHVFSKVIEIDLPNKSVREKMIKACVENYTEFEPPLNLDEVISKTEGFAAADLELLVRKTCHCAQMKLAGPDSKSSQLNQEDMLESLSGFTPASLQNAKLHKPSPLTWADVGGLEKVKEKLTEQLIWPIKYKHLFDGCGLEANSGVLLFGPPGCGKTLIAGVVANECDLNFISIKGPEVLSKYIGASEAAVRDLFSRAKAAAPCVLFFDEFDSLAPPRGHDSTGVTDRVVNQLLTHLDGVEPLVGVTVLAATSRPDLLDSALLRPGRLDNLLYCPLPDEEEREDILRSLSRNLPLHDVDLTTVAKHCENFSGADLKALLYNAQLEAVHDSIDAAKVNEDLNLPPTSFPAPSSTSTLSSKMEIDDLYYSNGFSNMEKYDEGRNQAISLTSIDEIKETAAQLINSLVQEDTDPPSEDDFKESYRICFDENRKYEKSKKVVEDCKLIYFPSMYQGRSGEVPESILNSAQILSRSVNHNDAGNFSKSLKSNTPPLLVESRHMTAAMGSTKPSLSIKERNELERLYEKFTRSRERGQTSSQDYYKGEQRATLS
uniref:peroxisome biogenesis protein 1-like n=1 Tax=Ciona intestinalis TaxID=7719 RepID=UPI000180C928|nr:peroxisome biogenesis protein 1-like [Ciona intestinalis]|eukprot:XP_026690933.1 peroxisome biogenesis protein 1-like [Ciona intestinalis]